MLEPIDSMIRRIGQLEMKTSFLDLICFAVLCVILTLGLWPFHSPKNEVTWLGNHNGLRFGRTALSSSGAFQMTSAESEVRQCRDLVAASPYLGLVHFPGVLHSWESIPLLTAPI